MTILLILGALRTLTNQRQNKRSVLLSASLHSFLHFPFFAMASDNPTAGDAVNGFTRPEMYSEKLAGTVDAYDRHVFISYKTHVSWPPRIEASDADPFPKRVAAVAKARKNDIALKVSLFVYCLFSMSDL